MSKEVMMVGAAIGQAMGQPRVRVKGEDNRLIFGEQRIEIHVA
jgi:hypothetical protein